jgi:hypothetical protein
MNEIDAANYFGLCRSSIVSPAFDVLSNEFGISREAAVLAVALYILGFALGPMMWYEMLLCDTPSYIL